MCTILHTTTLCNVASVVTTVVSRINTFPEFSVVLCIPEILKQFLVLVLLGSDEVVIMYGERSRSENRSRGENSLGVGPHLISVVRCFCSSWAKLTQEDT